MKNNYLSYLKEFIIGGSFLATISFIANNVDAGIAGLLVSIPFGILIIYFIAEEPKIIEYTITHTISAIILSISSIAFYYFYMVKGIHKNTTIIISLFIWIIVLYLVVNSNVKKSLLYRKL